MSATVSMESARAEFRAFVGDPRFPCLAGKGVVNSNGHEVGVYGALGSLRSTRELTRDLAAFVRTIAEKDAALRTFVAVFPQAIAAQERAFEDQLWTQLQRLHDAEGVAATWDAAVSDDPEDPQFSFSHAGCALFVVGLHPRSSRMARRFRWPALVFNPRAQFERLRSDGKFERLRGLVRDREIALQGTLNPNLADFGEQSEARQYSGRATEQDWKCPFHRERS
ncbi:MAG: YqcI/YcgG family protein [Gemmatimonadetes bacterium]|nr:YqcI/YcgG family protein [Gemmatimonadota bacterium]